MTYIPDGALKACYALRDIRVAQDNARYLSLGGALYVKAMTRLIAYPASGAETGFTIPYGVSESRRPRSSAARRSWK